MEYFSFNIYTRNMINHIFIWMYGDSGLSSYRVPSLQLSCWYLDSQTECRLQPLTYCQNVADHIINPNSDTSQCGLSCSHINTKLNDDDLQQDEGQSCIAITNSIFHSLYNKGIVCCSNTVCNNMLCILFITNVPHICLSYIL